MTFSVGGLSSGLDTKSIIDQLMSIEARPQVKLNWRMALWESRKSTWGDVNTRLNGLQGFANVLTNPATWTNVGGISSSDPTKVLQGSTALAPWPVRTR